MFLSIATGAEVNVGQLSPEQKVWLAYVKQQILRYPAEELRLLLQRPHVAINHQGALLKEMFLLLARLAEMFANEHNLSMDKALRLLSEPNQNLLDVNISEAHIKNKGRSLIFCCMSWMTMLYSTAFNPDANNLYLDHSQLRVLRDHFVNYCRTMDPFFLSKMTRSWWLSRILSFQLTRYTCHC